ncbi:Hypothetical Protein FCC1311_118172, partial [Hondaea fermentalgiana]
MDTRKVTLGSSPEMYTGLFKDHFKVHWDGPGPGRRLDHCLVQDGVHNPSCVENGVWSTNVMDYAGLQRTDGFRLTRVGERGLEFRNEAPGPQNRWLLGWHHYGAFLVHADTGLLVKAYEDGTIQLTDVADHQDGLMQWNGHVYFSESAVSKAMSTLLG